MATVTQDRVQVTPAQAGFFRDLFTIAGRAMRSLPRDPETIIPALIIPVFFFTVNLGALQDFAEQIPGMDYRIFQLPVAVIFAVTGISRANVLVVDIQSGYFDRLALTPVNRLALLLGLMVADFILVVALTLPVIALGLVLGVTFTTGILGILAFILMAGAWGLVFTGFPYAIALKTGNPGAVNSSFLLFFPFMFLTTASVPLEVMTGWMSTVARFNQVTYLLDGLRTVIGGGDVQSVLGALLAIGGVGAVSLTLALLALRGRVQRR
jgi:ABC-2 type transport system permease protein